MKKNNSHYHCIGALIIICFMIFTPFILSCGSSGGGDGDNNGNGNNNPPATEMTFEETYNNIKIEDRRETFLSTLGIPDTFKIDITEIEGRTVVSEEWSYINLGVRLDIVDGEVAYVIPIDDVEIELALFPRFYDPNEFRLPMARSEAMAILNGQTINEQDLAEGGYEGLQMAAGDQIILGFDGDKLVYVETFALIPDPDGEMDNLFIDDITAESALAAIGVQEELNKSKSGDRGGSEIEMEKTLAPHIIKGIFGIFKAFSKRNKAYREINAMLRDYRDYLQKLHDKAAELALDPCGINPIKSSSNPRLSNGATLIRIKTRLLNELNAVNALLEDEKNEARKKFNRDLIKTLTDYLTESGALAKVLNKIGVAKIRDSISELDTFISGAADPGNLQNFHTKLADRMSKLRVIGETLGGAVGSRVNGLIAKIQRRLPGVKQGQQAVFEEIKPFLEELDQSLANIQDQFSPDKGKRPSSQIVGTIEAIMQVMDDPEVDALSAALAKEMEPGIAKNQLIADGKLNPKQFVTLRERIRGAILQSGVQRIQALKPEQCGQTTAPAMRDEFEISARMQIAGVSMDNSDKWGSEIKTVSPQDDGYPGQFGIDDSPIPVCHSFPVDMNAVGEQTVTDLEKELYIDPPKDGCRKDNDGDGVNGPHVRGSDCDDSNPNRFPGNTEVCDEIDNDCNDIADDGLSTDFDGDGHFNLGSCSEPADDCDDLEPNRFPGNTEIKNDGIDQDCDGKDLTDEYVVYYTDNVRCWDAPWLYVGTRDKFNSTEYRCNQSGGGIDCTQELTKAEIQGGFLTSEEAHDWICPKISAWHFHYWCSKHWVVDGQSLHFRLGLACDTSNVGEIPFPEGG